MFGLKIVNIVTKEKISKTKKKQYRLGKLNLPDNTGKTPWNFGRNWSKEVRKKISAARKGSRPWNVGVSHSEQTKRKISQSRKGKLAWNKGLTISNNHKRAISKGMKFRWRKRESN